MDIFPQDIKDASEKIGSEFIKGAEFDGNGLVLQFAKPIEKITPTNPKYGAEETDFLVKNEILEVGQTLRYVFTTADGTDRKFDSASTPLFIGIKQCEDLGVGDWVHIVRTGKTDKTRYTATKVDKPLQDATSEQTSEVPF